MEELRQARAENAALMSELRRGGIEIIEQMVARSPVRVGDRLVSPKDIACHPNTECVVDTVFFCDQPGEDERWKVYARRIKKDDQPREHADIYWNITVPRVTATTKPSVPRKKARP